jgi:hypothetical protein
MFDEEERPPPKADGQSQVVDRGHAWQRTLSCVRFTQKGQGGRAIKTTCNRASLVPDTGLLLGAKIEKRWLPCFVLFPHLQLLTP